MSKAYCFGAEVQVGVVLSHERCSENNACCCRYRSDHHLALVSIDFFGQVRSRRNREHGTTNVYRDVGEELRPLTDIVGALSRVALAVKAAIHLREILDVSDEGIVVFC